MDVVAMFVEVDSVGRVSGGGGEYKHEIRDCTRPGVQNPKSAGIEAGWGRVVTPMVSEMNLAMMWLVANVRRPFQLVQSGGGSSVS